MRDVMTWNVCLFAVLLGAGCASEVGEASAALSRGGSDVYECFDHEPGSSICTGNGITFFSADLKLDYCDPTRTGTVCEADPADSPDMPSEFWSETEMATLSCLDDRVLTCTYVRGTDHLACWCAPTGDGLADEGGGDDGTIIWEIVQ